MKKFNELTTEELWDVIHNVIRDVDNNDCYGNVYVNVYKDENGDEVLVFDDNDSVKSFNKMLIEEFTQKRTVDYLGEEIDITEELEEMERFTNHDDYFVNLVTENNWTFSDEGFVCSDCYTWHYYDDNCGCSYTNYFMGDGFIVCKDCLENNEEYMEMFLDDKINNPRKANTILSEDKLKELGFEKINEHYYENGWYGDNDQPSEILEKAKEKFPEKEFIFNVRKIYNPFTTQFDLYGREVE